MDSVNGAFRLYNGVEIPCPGFGTWQTPEDTAAKAVACAIEAGYTHIDTAAVYGNETGVGQGIRDSGALRNSLFITTKLWNTDRGYKNTLEAFEKSLERLGLDYVDLYLIHWPANELQFGSEATQINCDTWRALEHIYVQGGARAIGVSNFLPRHLAPVLSGAKTPQSRTLHVRRFIHCRR